MRVPRFVVAMVCVCAALLAQPDAHAQSAVPTAEPVRSITFEESQYVQGVRLSNDGTRAFVVLSPDAVNVWALAVYYWPELLGGLGAVVSLGGILCLLRILRRRQLAGKRCCRKCGYCVEHCSLDRCPECGYARAVPRAVVGRSTWRRAFPVVLVAGLYWCGYVVALVLRVPRTGEVARLCDWWSFELEQWATDNNIDGIAKHGIRASQIAEVDIATGAVTRRLLTGALYRIVGESLSPDGTRLIVNSPNRELLAVNLHTGRVDRRARYSNQRDRSGLAKLMQVVGYSSDGQTAYYVFFDRPAHRTQLIAWDLRSGDTEVIYETDARRYDSSCGTSWRARYLRQVPGPGQLLLESSSRPYGHWPLQVHLRDLARDGQIIREWSDALWCGEPLVDPTGRCMYVLEYKGSTEVATDIGSLRDDKCFIVELSGWDILTGEQTSVFEEKLTVTEDPFSEVLTYDAHRGYVFAATYGLRRKARPDDGVAQRLWRGIARDEGLMVVAGDPRTGTWVHCFRCPHAIRVGSLAVSADGSTLAVVVYASRRLVTSAKQLLLFDLTVLDDVDGRGTGDK